MIGKTISHYKILEKLGEGGMGVVYKAEDIKLERIVALKFLPPHLSDQEDEKKRFIHEAKAASSLEHNNICTIHEIDETKDGQLFIVMSFLEGKTLRAKIDASLLKVDEAMDIAIQAAEGLKLAHEKGIVHRDIKPSNLIITTDNTVKIMDFGLAKLAGKTKLTQKGATLGTFSYMSPEQSRGEEVDYRTDIWSLGVVLYEMLTGQLPFKGEYEQAVIFALMNEPPEPITSLRSNVPLELERIVNKTLAKDPDERYKHFDELIADLRIERKNLEYARLGYSKASTINRISKEKSADVKKLEKRLALKIIIPSVAAILLVIVFFILNPFYLGIGQKPTSETPNKSLAVMYFENIPDPEDKDHTGEMLTNLLITSLSQVNGLEVISRERLLDIQKDLRQTDAKVLSPFLASNVAKKAGVNAMLIGSILQKDPKLVVTTRLINVQSGKIISSQQLTNFSANQIFNLVDSLSYLLRDKFQIVPTKQTGIKPVSDVTTKSTEAYRAYVAGLEFRSTYHGQEAMAAFERAIELDSTFAMAYYYLGNWISMQKAVELSDNVTELERLQILASYYAMNNWPDKAEEYYEKLIVKYPHQINSYSRLSSFYINKLLKPEKAVKVLLKGLRINPSTKYLWNLLAFTYAYLYQKEEALKAANEYISLAPAEHNSYDTKGSIFDWFQDYDSSSIEYKKTLKFRKDFITTAKLGVYAVLRQRYNDAKEYFQTYNSNFPVIEIYRGQLKAVLKEIKGDSLNYLYPHFMRNGIPLVKINLYYETGQFPEMLRIANDLYKEMKKNPTNVICGRDYLAWALVKNGKSVEAHKLLEDIQKDVSDRATVLQVYADYSSALVSFEEKKYDLALQKFKKVFSKLPLNREPNFFYAVTLLKCGQLHEAVKEFKRLLYWPSFLDFYLLANIPGSLDYWHIPAVKAHYWLGVAYEQQGKKDIATKEYEKFLDIWKDADFNSPEIKDARMRLSKLKEVALK